MGQSVKFCPQCKRESVDKELDKWSFEIPSFRLSFSQEDAEVASFICYVSYFPYVPCATSCLDPGISISFSPSLFQPTLGYLSEVAVKFSTSCWVSKDLSRCLSRQLFHSAVWSAFSVLCTNPLPFMGLQPLGYLSYLIAREHISGVLE